MKLWLRSFSFILIGMSANAFDKLYCESDLKGWIITVSDSTKSAILTPYNQSVFLGESQSQKLIFKDTKADNIITVFPWNSLYVRTPEKTKKEYEVRSTEVSSGFLVEVVDKKKIVRSLDCRFTF